VQLWRTRGGQTSASPSLACRRPRADHFKLPSNESKRGVNPTHTEPQPDTAGGVQHRGETAQGGNSTRGNPPANKMISDTSYWILYCMASESYSMRHCI